ncbi:MAG: hypothetical protein K0U72_13290 [Gammaproteobacteria bacterium]|nr:hypothetical protein [Gammaproteobacteria bacterium]
MGRNIAAAIAGILIAGGIVMIVDMIGHTVFPPPPNLNFEDSEAVRAYIGGLPVGAFLFVVAGWSLGSLGGTFAACHFGKSRPVIGAYVVGGFVLLATAYNLVVYPHPVWIAILGIAGIIGGAWLGMSLEKPARSKAE